MIDTVAIRKKILELAYQGDLVSQNKTDGNVDLLYSNIRKYVANKELPEVEKDEIFAKIPDNWKWVRIGNIAKINPKNDFDDEEAASFVPMALVTEGFQNQHSFEVKKWGEIKKGYNHFREGDIGVAKITPCFQNRKSVIFQNLHNGIGACTTELIILRSERTLLLGEYLLYFLKTENFILRGVESFTGVVGQQRIRKDYLKMSPIPLPPVEEQRRIVKKIKETFELLDVIDMLQQQYLSNLEVLKSKIIDAGIQGKLTEQLPEDGTAEELYVSVIEEKKQIVEDRKGREDKNIKELDDEVPYELPTNWKWVRFGEIGLFKKGPFGSALTKAMFVPKSDDTVKVYEQQHAIQKNSELGTYYITREYFDDKMSGFEVLPGDIIVSCAGTIGETYILPDEIEQGIINQALMRVSLVPSVNKRFFQYYFDANLKKTAQEESNGSTIKNIPPFDVMKNWYFPLAPLKEQERIVDRIDELLSLI